MTTRILLALVAVAIPLVIRAATTNWKNELAVELGATAFHHATLDPKPNSKYVTVDLEFEPFSKVRIDVEERRAVRLKNRGEAHITILSPPEFDLLTKILDAREVRDLVAHEIKLTAPDVHPICVGQGRVAAEETWFVVIDMPSALKARRSVEKHFRNRGGKPDDFRAELFYPHVTLGFTSRDLHLQDGVAKDVSSCKFPIRP